jgi:hypothetical protein
VPLTFVHYKYLSQLMTKSVESSDSGALAKAHERIRTLEAELLEKDRILEVVMCDHDRDIDDLRKSFEMGKPPLPPLSRKRADSQQSVDQTRWSVDSGALHEQSDQTACKECIALKKQLRAYKKQWAEINRNFKQVPSLLESMITRTDNLVTNITKLSN